MSWRASILAILAMAAAASAETNAPAPRAAAPSGSLAVARRALGDGVWSAAERNAAAVAATTADAAERETARLIELEALAGAGRNDELLARLDAWKDAKGEGFRYWRAWACVQAGRAGEARTLLGTQFTQREYAALALRLAARLEASAGNRAAAAERFAAAGTALAGNPRLRAENAAEWAEMLERSGNPAEGLAVLKREGALEQVDAAGDAARLLAARLSESTGDLKGGRDLLAALVVGGTNTDGRAYVLASCMLAERQLKDGEVAAAAQTASNAVARAKGPDLDCRARLALGFSLLANPSNRSEGVALVSATVRRHADHPASDPAQLRLADALLTAGDAAGALREYDVLLQAYPAHALDAHVLEGRGWAFMQLGRRAEAVGIFARAAQVTTNAQKKAWCAFKQAEALVADGRHEEAAAVFGTVADPSLRERAQFRRADALARAKQLDAALKIYDTLFKEGGGTAVEAGLRKAAIESNKGQVEEAVAAYSAVLDDQAAVKPTPEQRGRALAGRGRALYRAYRFRDADRDFTEVAKVQPERKDEMAFLSALCLYGDGRDREAYDQGRWLLKSVTDSPLKADLQMWLAKYDAGRREWSEAIAQFEACAANPRATDAFRIEALVRAARCAAAVPDFPKVVELAGRVVTNAVAVEAAAQARPESGYVAEALVLQGEALIELARFDEAVQVLGRAVHVPTSGALLRRASMARADCLFAMGADDAKRYRGALEVYRTMLHDEDMPDSLRISAAFKAGRALEKLGRMEEATDMFYTSVVLAYWDGVRPDAPDTQRRRWFDGNARAVFARAAFLLADYYETRGELTQAVRVLGYVVAARVPAADEAAKRIERLKAKGGEK